MERYNQLQESRAWDSIDSNRMFDYKNQLTLKAPIRSKMNREFNKMGDYFDELPIDEMFDVLLKYNIVPLQEDYTKWAGMFLGGGKRTERASMHLGYMNPETDEWQVIKNAMLIFTYYYVEGKSARKWEVIKYIS